MAGHELAGGSFLSSSLQVVFERLASSDIKHYFHESKNMDALLKKLHIALISVNQVLDDAEEQQYTDSNVNKWLDELKHAVYLIDDFLDEIASESTKQNLEANSQTANQFDKQIESRIQRVLDNLEFLAKQKDVLGLKEGCNVGDGEKVSNRLPTTSLVNELKIYGRDDDIENMIKFLCFDIDEKLSVISIVGMGGIGKTTLAQLVYNDTRMEDQFQLKAWVCVSEELDVVRITKAILSAVGGSMTGYEDFNQLQLSLKHILMGKKFLIFLDNMWNNDPTSWEALRVPFLCGSLGSKILVTTRNEKVALVMHSVQMHQLQLLNEEEGWELFAKHAFNDKEAGAHIDLESIGRKIVEKCKGLPLAIKLMGNLLHTNLSEQHWKKIHESDLWKSSLDESIILPVLRLSYHYLPSHMKPCFAFCSIFPKGYEIDKALLIKMWMAEGLLHYPQGNWRAEELGDDIFSALESRSFFQQADSWNKRHYVMHDLVSDLTKSVSGEFCAWIDRDNKVQNISTKARYFSCSSITSDSDQILEPVYECKLLRSFVAMESEISFEAMKNLLKRFQYLRILWLRCGNIRKLTDEISNLKYLRYLELSQALIERLPDSFCALHNLQTLNLDGCVSLVELPSNIDELINLRHLHLSQTRISKLPDSICKLHNLHTLSLAYCRLLAKLPTDFHKLINLHYLDLVGTRIREIPKHMGSLKHLQYLPQIFVGRNTGSNIKELGKVNNLRETLSISQLENIDDAIDAGEAKMRDKKCLEKLELIWHENLKDSQDERSILEALQPHINLKMLTVTNYGGTIFVDWFDAHFLPNLVSLELRQCRYISCFPPLGKLPSLKWLSIHGFEGIKEVGAEFYGNNKLSSVAFRSLVHLEFGDMKEWEEWMHCEGECFPCLEQLYLRRCPKLKNSLPPFLARLKSLWITECQQLELSLPKAVAMTNADNPENQKDDESWMQQIVIKYPNLEDLRLRNCPKLVSLPICEFYSPKLRSFSIENWSHEESLHKTMMQTQVPTLVSLQFKNCPNLHSLHLKNCTQLESLHINRDLPSASSLAILSIRECPKLIHSFKLWDFHRLHSLREISISDDSESLECHFFPHNLTHVSFVDCPNLKTINDEGLLHLKSLQSLTFGNCTSLQCLPEKGLPSSLSHLHIWGNCPLLMQRYLEENAQHWHEISHIPNVLFG